MKRLPLVISLAVVALVAVVTGCGGARYDSRLAAADSLMHDHPDSALALIEAVGPASLTTEGDRAYRDLLLTQTRYRCYITATSDSDINRALDYYRRHSGEREKLTRAYIYKGAVMEELGHPDSAMFYYKTAEATAVPNDYFNQGFCNLRIAKLYESFFYNDSAVISRLKNATRFFTACQDTGYLITSLGSQGSYHRILGEDSARVYFRMAIDLAKKINSPKGLQYQSKLAGDYYYDGDYYRAKELAMDIVRNGKEKCNEKQFFYYAARSYIKLNHIDSALWVKSQIPDPISSVDSMNDYLLMAELCQEFHDYHDYASYAQKADMIQKRLMKNSINSGLVKTELYFDAAHRENELESNYTFNLTIAICLFMLLVVILAAVGALVIKVNAHRYQKKLDHTRSELEQLISDSGKKMQELQFEKEKQKMILDSRGQELEEIRRKNRELESKQSDITKQVSFIIRCRQNALNELYQGIRVKSETRRVRSVIPLVGLIKDLNEKKKLLHTVPKDSFWTNLKLAVDGEYEGIASFVEKEYPSLTIKELHLFWLLCAKLPSQIIKICMDYTNDVTVSNNKRRLMKEKIGLDLKFEEFIHLYLEGKIHRNISR